MTRYTGRESFDVVATPTEDLVMGRVFSDMASKYTKEKIAGLVIDIAIIAEKYKVDPAELIPTAWKGE